MVKRKLSNMRKWVSYPLPLLWRIALLTAGLLAILGLGLTVFTNVVTSVRIPQVLMFDLSPTQYPDPETTPTSTSSDPPPTDHPGNSQSMDQIQQIAIREFRLISIIGIVLFSIFGALGTYSIARKAIYPLQHLNHLIAKIQPESLDQRLSLERPEDEIKVLADTFDEMLDRLEGAFEQQGRFIADAAHELRTPLANMRANLEVIREDSRATEEDYRDLSQTFDRSLARVERLVEDLLLLAKGEGQFQWEPACIEDLLKKVIWEAEDLAQSKQVEVNQLSQANHVMELDGPLFSIALRNLIQNAIQYNRHGGSVTIDVQEMGRMILIRIEDTGIGIPDQDLPHIFERFYRADQSRRKNSGGSGLGLSIAAHIVELHGGFIEVDSEEGIGSCFTVRLPIQ